VNVKQRVYYSLVGLLLTTSFLTPIVPAQKRQGRAVSDSQGASRTFRIGRDSVSSEATSELEKDFAEALTIVQENYVDGGRLEYNSIFKSSIVGMLRSLDPHSNYYDRREFDELRTDQRSEYYGIGASIGDRTVNDSTDTYILATFPNSPAARAGLRFGDRIIEVDNQSMKGRPSGDVRDRIRGPRGSAVKLKVEKAATGKVESVDITRDAVAQPSVPDAYLIKPGVGYVAMSGGFNYTTADELQASLDSLRSRGMASLILDLRNNPGGFLDQAIRVADKFLQRGQVILTQKGRIKGTDRTYTAENGAPDNVPLVILINRNTASASEIVAGAMQDHDRAIIVGETSFGKGLVQSIIPLEYGSGLTLTSAKYFTPSGRLIQRDYSNGGLYDYYTRGGLNRSDENEKPNSPKPAGTESRTDTGRPVYSGGGIAPDEAIKPRIIQRHEQRLVDPIFAFARDLVNGRVAGYDSYKVTKPIEFGHDLKPTDFPVTEQVYKSFKEFVAKRPAYKITDAQLDRSRDFVMRQIRYDVITAAYGTVTATQVLNFDDPQIARAVDLVPRARDLALSAMRGRNPPERSF
jgi:carboxyl-terminal processing protease